MKFNFFYFFGSFILFLGLLWVFLPHTAHQELLPGDEVEHLYHTLQGAAVVVVGLGIMIVSRKKKN